MHASAYSAMPKSPVQSECHGTPNSLALTIRLRDSVHRERTGAFEPTVLAGSLIQLEKRKAVPGGPVTKAWALA